MRNISIGNEFSRQNFIESCKTCDFCVFSLIKLFDQNSFIKVCNDEEILQNYERIIQTANIGFIVLTAYMKYKKIDENVLGRKYTPYLKKAMDKIQKLKKSEKEN